MEDNFAITKILEGDTSYFCHIIDRYTPVIFNYTRKRFNNLHDAEDAMQNIWIAIFLGLSSFRQDSKFFPWMYSIMRNECMDRSKNIARDALNSLTTIQENITNELSIIDDRQNIENNFILQHSIDIMHMCINELPNYYKNVMKLYYIDNIPADDVADKLHLTKSTTRMRLMRGRQLLQTLAKPHLSTINA